MNRNKITSPKRSPYSNAIARAFLLAFCMLFGAVPTGVVQAQTSDRIAVPFSDPSRPGKLEASLVHGGITIKGYDGKEVIIEAKTRTRIHKGHRDSREAPEGMKRLTVASTGLSVVEEHNEMEVSASSHVRTVDLDIQVPRNTSLSVSTVNNGDITIEKVSGEIEANNVNGEIKIVNVSGTVLANTTNGDVTVSLNKVTSDKPMSFASFNGDVDVTLPANVKADVKLKTEHGDIYSDFDIKLEERAKTIKKDNRAEGGKFRLQVESALYGSINGGGPEFHFSTYNGRIYIRKAK